MQSTSRLITRSSSSAGPPADACADVVATVLLAVCGTLVSLRAQRKYNDVGKGASHAEDTDGSSSSGEDGSVASYEDASAMAARTIQASARHLLARKLATVRMVRNAVGAQKDHRACAPCLGLAPTRSQSDSCNESAPRGAASGDTRCCPRGVARTIQACARRLLARHLLAHMKQALEERIALEELLESSRSAHDAYWQRASALGEPHGASRLAHGAYWLVGCRRK